ncbi:glutamic acid-rich protein-like [Leptopilina heterotoma]|uniref:glutamic acid-rich protein-like n=1 Tax=Leptopilina heterotoma TaxID=63436 RepID=UPI001CA9CD53|nr:glutamic acid-rich protein-like [Leptopilina heterotoma]XP_043469625.1 glutamic acid-rich protein-like [Leptopilina heterotoma]
MYLQSDDENEPHALIENEGQDQLQANAVEQPNAEELQEQIDVEGDFFEEHVEEILDDDFLEEYEEDISEDDFFEEDEEEFLEDDIVDEYEDEMNTLEDDFLEEHEGEIQENEINIEEDNFFEEYEEEILEDINIAAVDVPKEHEEGVVVNNQDDLNINQMHQVEL